MSELDSGAAKASYGRALDVLDAQLHVEGADAGRTGEDLFAVTSLLDDSVALRRALTDPAREGSAKAEFVRRALGGRVVPAALETVAALAGGRWTASRDIADACERLAVVAVVTQAERSGRLEALEDELFRFSRLVAGSPGLRDALADRTAPADSRAELVSRLLHGRAAPEAVQLARRVAVAPRGVRAERLLEQYVDIAAQRRRQLVAHVVSAQPLEPTQRDRLAAALRRAALGGPGRTRRMPGNEEGRPSRRRTALLVGRTYLPVVWSYARCAASWPSLLIT